MDEDDVMVVVLAVRMMIIMAILMMTGSFTGNHILFQSTAGYPSAKTKHLQNCVSPHRRARINQDCWPELRIGMFSLFSTHKLRNSFRFTVFPHNNTNFASHSQYLLVAANHNVSGLFILLLLLRNTSSPLEQIIRKIDV